MSGIGEAFSGRLNLGAFGVSLRFSEAWLYYLACLTFFVLPMGTSPSIMAGVCLLLAWLAGGNMIRRSKSYLRESWLWPIVGVIMLTWAGLLYSSDPGGLGLKYAQKTYYWLFVLPIAGIPFAAVSAENLVKSLLAGLAVNAAVGFFQLGGILPVGYEGRYTGLSSGYNTLGILLVLGILVASYGFRTARHRRVKGGYAFLMVVYFLHLVILRGRGGYVTFALLSPMVVYNMAKGTRVLIMFLLYLLVITIMSSFPFVQERVVDSLHDMRIQMRSQKDVAWGKHYSEDESVQRFDRIYMWRWAIDLFLEKPLVGVGTGGYCQSTLMGGGERGIAHPHNNVLHVAVSFGILGLLIYLWFFWVLIRNGWRNRRQPLGFFILAVGLVILVGGLTDTHILDVGPSILLALTAGLQAGFTDPHASA